ncbi:MAG TPA: efflux RND transporter periplasmic adaptor subunit [Vicinamibacterales bacterium]|nr:efflux RND transporter periplasmic adaptor subunit [Vicinamibacterales bacterium]
MKRLIVSAVPAFAALIVASACSGHAAAPVDAAHVASPAPGIVVIPPDSPMLGQIKREAVKEAELPTEEVTSPGKIEANPNRVSKVLLPVTGRVTAVLVKTGDAVAKDQPLLTLESPDADSAMSADLSAQANVTQAQAALVKAQADYDRASDLFAHDAVARKDVLTAESALTQAKAALEQAQAARQQAMRKLTVLGLHAGDFDQHVTLRSPLSGKVLDLSIVAGEYRNDTSAPVMTIADLSTVWISSQVPESYIRFVQLGEQIDASLVAYPGETFRGKVSRIADTVDPQTRSVKVQAELDNRDGRLRPEMFGSIHHIESIEKTTVVPAGAVMQSDTHTAVFVETAPGRFEQRDVTLGTRAGDLFRVVSGVKPGDRVVTDGVMLLKGLQKRT